MTENEVIIKKQKEIDALKAELKRASASKTTFADAYFVGVTECVEMIKKMSDKTSIGNSLRMMTISESDLDAIKKELIRSKKVTAKEMRCEE